MVQLTLLLSFPSCALAIHHCHFIFAELHFDPELILECRIARLWTQMKGNIDKIALLDSDCFLNTELNSLMMR